MPDGALKCSFVRALKYAQQPGQHTISAMRNVQCVRATSGDSSLTSIRHTHVVSGMRRTLLAALAKPRHVTNKHTNESLLLAEDTNR